MNKHVNAAVDEIKQARAEAAHRWPEDPPKKIEELMLEAFNMLNSDSRAVVNVRNLIAKYEVLRLKP